MPERLVPVTTWGRGNAWGLACAAAVAVQLVVLYAPRAPSTGGAPYLDKAVHVAVFAAVGLTAVPAGARARAVVAVLAAHAVVSEAVQAVALPGRSGDAWDVVADAVGAVAGVAFGVALHRRRAR